MKSKDVVVDYFSPLKELLTDFLMTSFSAKQRLDVTMETLCNIVGQQRLKIGLVMWTLSEEISVPHFSLDKYCQRKMRLVGVEGLEKVFVLSGKEENIIIRRVF